MDRQTDFPMFYKFSFMEIVFIAHMERNLEGLRGCEKKCFLFHLKDHFALEIFKVLC